MEYEADKYTYKIEWSDEDEAYIAHCLEFPSLAAHGYTPEEALEEIKTVVQESIEWLEEEKEFVPPPLSLRKYKGNLTLRVHPRIHRLLAIKATEEGLSINQYINRIIEININYSALKTRLNEIDRIIKNLNEQITQITNFVSTLNPIYRTNQFENLKYLISDIELSSTYSDSNIWQLPNVPFERHREEKAKIGEEEENYVSDSIGGLDT